MADEIQRVLGKHNLNPDDPHTFAFQMVLNAINHHFRSHCRGLGRPISVLLGCLEAFHLLGLLRVGRISSDPKLIYD